MYSTDNNEMSIDVSVPEAATQLAELVNRVRSGEEVIISEAGVPVARLLPIRQKPRRIPGQDKGKVVIAPDFNDLLPEEILNDFLNPATPQL